MSALLLPAAGLLAGSVAYLLIRLADAAIRRAARWLNRRREEKALFAHIDEMELLEALWALPEASRRNTGPRPRKETQ